MEIVYEYIGNTENDHFTKGKRYAKFSKGALFQGAFYVIDDMDKEHRVSEVFLKNFFTLVETGLLKVSQDFVQDRIDPIAGQLQFPPAPKVSNEGLRFNTGKTRHDLLHPIATEGLARVMTKGSQKYAERNWEKGMSWSKVLASLKRHVAAFESGVDYDSDSNCSDCQKSTKDSWVCKNHTGELHVDLIQANSHFLSAYYKIYPQGDDRPHKYLNQPRIGLDIDEVLCNWIGDWTEKYDLDSPTSWFFDREMLGKFEDLKSKGELDNFYLSLKPLIKPEDIPFEPHCYITSRPVTSEITERWLALHGFPARPVFTTTEELGKVDIAIREGVEIFVDDGYHNFTALNRAGICCFLMDAKHNRRYDVGYKRITSLKDL